MIGSNEKTDISPFPILRISINGTFLQMSLFRRKFVLLYFDDKLQNRIKGMNENLILLLCKRHFLKKFSNVSPNDFLKIEESKICLCNA